MRQKNSRGIETLFKHKYSCLQAGSARLAGVSIIILAHMFLAGCRHVNAPAVPYAKWAPPKKASNLSTVDQTWAGIRSRNPGTQDALTLAVLLDTAFYNSPVTSRAWQDVRAKGAILGQKKSDLFPQVTIGADGTREKSISNTDIGDINQIRYGPSGRAELLLFDFGGRDASIEAAYQDMLSSGFMFNQALQDLILNVKTAYYDLFSAKSRLEAAEADVLDARETLDAARLKFQVGIVSKLDQLQAETGYNNALYNLEDAKAFLKTAHANLATVIGFSADTCFDIARPADDLPVNIHKSDVQDMIDQALSERPDIASARSGLIQKQALVKEASSRLFPKISMGGTYDHNWYKYYNARHLRDDDYGYAGYLSLDWDVFDGFYNINKKLQAEAELQQEQDKLTELELKASADVWTRYYNYNTAVKKLEFSNALLESSMASHELALEGYSEGLRSMLDLLQAQSDLSGARAKLIDSKRGLFIAVAELSHATGALSAE
jgi:outer membrane protein